jgi:WhiB family redox-sensing transcriptional regulator
MTTVLIRSGATATAVARPASASTYPEDPVSICAAAAVPDSYSLVPDDGADILFDAAQIISDLLPCRVQDADLWFADLPAELDQAKAFCADCPVRRSCLTGAIARREPWGVWGGEIFEHGAIVARKRPRGRPRKDQAA